MIPRNERIDLHVHPDFKRFVLGKAGELPLNDFMVQVVCAYYGVDSSPFKMERRRAGRRAAMQEPDATSQASNPKPRKRKS